MNIATCTMGSWNHINTKVQIHCCTILTTHCCTIHTTTHNMNTFCYKHTILLHEHVNDVFTLFTRPILGFTPAVFAESSLGGIKVIKVIFFGSAKTYETANREKTTLIRRLFKEL